MAKLPPPQPSPRRGREPEGCSQLRAGRSALRVRVANGVAACILAFRLRVGLMAKQHRDQSPRRIDATVITMSAVRRLKRRGSGWAAPSVLSMSSSLPVELNE